MEFSGRLQAFPMAELLAWAANDRRTGSLLLRRPEREVRVYFRAGGIVACRTDQPEEYFGQHLLLEGLIDQETLLRVLEECRESGARLGRALRDRGHLDENAIVPALRNQIADLVLGTFLWRNGVFAFRAELPPKELTLEEPIDPMTLAFEGARWIDEHRRFRERVPSDRTRIGPGSGWPGEGLSPRQERIVEHLKARPALDEIYPKVRGSRFRFLAGLAELIEVGIAEVVHRAEEERREDTLYEMLHEQASEEQRQDLRASVRFPIEVLERLVPVWVETPKEDHLRALPVRTRTFLEQLDGSQRLGGLLSEAKDARREEIELILLHLQDESLALLPAPVRELADRRSLWRRLIGR